MNVEKGGEAGKDDVICYEVRNKSGEDCSGVAMDSRGKGLDCWWTRVVIR